MSDGTGNQRRENDTHVVGKRAADALRSEEMLPKDAIKARERSAERRRDQEQEE